MSGYVNSRRSNCARLQILRNSGDSQRRGFPLIVVCLEHRRLSKILKVIFPLSPVPSVLSSSPKADRLASAQAVTWLAAHQATQLFLVLPCAHHFLDSSAPSLRQIFAGGSKRGSALGDFAIRCRPCKITRFRDLPPGAAVLAGGAVGGLSKATATRPPSVPNVSQPRCNFGRSRYLPSIRSDFTPPPQETG